MRTVREWIGKSDDTRPPPRVRLRVFIRDDGTCQCGCKLRITLKDRWQTDHRIALINGGENRETNLVTLLDGHHKIKTREDVALKSKTYRLRRKQAGLKKRRSILGWRRFNGEIVRASRER
jgi:5-methylcytosine-specific restriction protein A